MGKKHRKTFEQIHQKPNCHTVKWSDFVSLLEYLEVEFKKQSGSGVGVRLNGIYAVFHKPHPENEIYESDLTRIRRFLQEAGIDTVE